MPEPTDFIRLAERSLEVEWVQGAVTPVARPHTTGWRVLPFLVTAQLLGGRSLIEVDGAEHELRHGQALCIGAGVRHRITLQTPQPARSLWSHVHARLFGAVDLMTILAVPVVVDGPAAERVGGINRRLAELHAAAAPRLGELIERRSLGFALLGALAEAAPAEPRSLQSLQELQELQRLAPVLAFIEQNLGDEPLDLPQLARRARLSPSRFSAVFRRALGQAPSRYIQSRRMGRAEALLIGTELQVQEITARTGFGDPFHFSRLFAKRHGVSPRAYREQARAASI
jgi:AraC-like DNA-binding protein